MRKMNTHGVTFKKKLNKISGIFRTHGELALKFGEELDKREDIIEIKANCSLEDFELGNNYITDFVSQAISKNI